MNVLLTLTTVAVLPHVPILWGASPVPVILGSLGMESAVMVGRDIISSYIHVSYSNYPLLL